MLPFVKKRITRKSVQGYWRSPRLNKILIFHTHLSKPIKIYKVIIVLIELISLVRFS